MQYTPVRRAQGQGSARPQRLFQLLTILYDATSSTTATGRRLGMPDTGWLSTGEIARQMGVSTSPHLRGMLDELLGKGAIKVQAVDWRPNMQAYVWHIGDNTRWSDDWKAAFDAWLEPDLALL